MRIATAMACFIVALENADKAIGGQPLWWIAAFLWAACGFSVAFRGVA